MLFSKQNRIAFYLLTALLLLSGMYVYTNHAAGFQKNKKVTCCSADQKICPQPSSCPSDMPEEVDKEDEEDKNNTQFIFGIIIPYFTPKAAIQEVSVDPSFSAPANSLQQPFYILHRLIRR